MLGFGASVDGALELRIEADGHDLGWRQIPAAVALGTTLQARDVMAGDRPHLRALAG